MTLLKLQMVTCNVQNHTIFPHARNKTDKVSSILLLADYLLFSGSFFTDMLTSIIKKKSPGSNDFVLKNIYQICIHSHVIYIHYSFYSNFRSKKIFTYHSSFILRIFKRRRISNICRQPIPKSGGCKTKRTTTI